MDTKSRFSRTKRLKNAGSFTLAARAECQRLVQRSSVNEIRQVIYERFSPIAVAHRHGTGRPRLDPSSDRARDDGGIAPSVVAWRVVAHFGERAAWWLTRRELR